MTNHYVYSSRKHWTMLGITVFTIVVSLVVVAAVIRDVRNQPKLREYAQMKQKELEIRNIERTLTIYYSSLTQIEVHFYAPVFYERAKQYGVNWPIFPAVKWAESRWQSGLVSGAGAQGPMQILEETAPEYCKQLGIPYKSGVTLRNDILNVNIGCAFLSKWVNHFKDKNDPTPYTSTARCYISGPNFRKNLNAGPNTRAAILDYSKLVIDDYKSLMYIYRGIVIDTSKIQE